MKKYGIHYLDSSKSLLVSLHNGLVLLLELDVLGYVHAPIPACFNLTHSLFHKDEVSLTYTRAKTTSFLNQELGGLLKSQEKCMGVSVNWCRPATLWVIFIAGACVYLIVLHKFHIVYLKKRHGTRLGKLCNRGLEDSISLGETIFLLL
jgi:hypothetical protein